MESMNEKEIDMTRFLIRIQNRNLLLNVPSTTNQLTKGFLDVFEIPLKTLEVEINDLISRQERCIVETQQEYKKLCNVREDVELHNLFSTLATYYTKLMNIKLEVTIIHEKISKLKKRVFRYQQAKQKEMFQADKL